MGESSIGFMLRAIELSRRGYPAPNPRVGCVIVNDGAIVGEGWHDHAGGDHAEIVAIKKAGTRAKGARAYCTLEPCNHEGRTPPCSRAIIDAQIKEVTFAAADPNPVAAGGGDALERTGIVVHRGLLRREAVAANEVFMTAVERRRPFVVCKSAQTTDGFIARDDGTSKWITCEESRLQGHRLRAELGCVLVGRITIERDDPELTARIEGVKNQPVRAVIDPDARLSSEYRVFRAPGTPIRFVRKGVAAQSYDCEVDVTADGLDLVQVLAALYSKGVIGVLAEGGGRTISSFLRARLVDRLELFVSPKVFGSGRPWLGDSPPQFELELLRESKIGEDTWRTYAPR